MNIPDDITDMAEELEEAAAIENSDLGDWWVVLAAMRHVINNASDRLVKAWIAEVKAEHRHLKENFKVVEEVREIKQVVKRLEFLE